MTRKIEVLHGRTTVMCIDEPRAGGACHMYRVFKGEVSSNEIDIFPVAAINFQNGPICENGVNGCTNEDLLSIVADRLKGFQSGQFACPENALALANIEKAMHWLNNRTQARMKRGAHDK